MTAWPIGVRHWLGAARSAAVDAPVLQQQEVAQILARGRHLDALAGAPASEFSAGDIPSRRAGSGMEFDDNRPYAAGDDARHINWRLSARAGTTYVKVFREERRPCAFVLLDRRPAMRFATAGRLKVTQAAILALRFAAAATARGAPLGALVLNAEASWLPARHGDTGLRALMHAATAPAPPLQDVDEPALSDVLSQLAARLRPGCDLLMVSDFVDLDDRCLTHLARLGDEHRVRALQVTDPAEIDLPDAGVMELTRASGGTALAVDTRQAVLRETYRQLAQAQMQTQRGWFAAAGVGLRRISTVDDALTTAIAAS